MILVFGAGGQLGQELLAAGKRRGAAMRGVTRAQADVVRPQDIARAIADVNPDLIVNAAAYTAVDKAESDPAAAILGNAVAPALLGAAAAAHGVPIIHYSTDYVFDGRKQSPYVETDAPCPLGIYGASKLAGEQALALACPAHVILRTSWVYGVYGGNFLKTMLRLAGERDELRVVADQFGAPTSTASLAEAALTIAPKIIASSRARQGAPWGVYHFTGGGTTSWRDFADAIVAAAAPKLGKRPSVAAIATADYPTPAKRPANSVLSNEKFISTFGYAAPDWRIDARRTVDELLNAKG